MNSHQTWDYGTDRTRCALFAVSDGLQVGWAHSIHGTAAVYMRRPTSGSKYQFLVIELSWRGRVYTRRFERATSERGVAILAGKFIAEITKGGRD